MLRYAYAIPIAIDHTSIEANLTDFKVKVVISESSGLTSKDVSAVFDELGENSKKIAVTTSDGTQLYVEIELWDSVNKIAILWVRVPSVSSISDDLLWLYFDAGVADNDTYVGDINSTPGGLVWTRMNFCSHMKDGADNQHLYDSTPNDNDMTKGSAGVPAETVTPYGYAQDFTSITDKISLSSSLVKENVKYIDVLVKQDQTAKEGGRGQYYCEVLYQHSANDNTYVDWTYYYFPTVKPTSGSIHHLAFVFPNSLADVRGGYCIYDGVKHNISYYTGGGSDYVCGNIPRIGNVAHGADNYALDGLIYEFRTSSEDLGEAWAKATYHSLMDTLLTFGDVVSIYSADSARLIIGEQSYPADAVRTITGEQIYIADSLRKRWIPPIALRYIIEVRNSSDELLAILQNAHGIKLVEEVNRPPLLDFKLPADDSKLTHINRSNQIWLRDYETGDVVYKFVLSRRGDSRD